MKSSRFASRFSTSSASVLVALVALAAVAGCEESFNDEDGGGGAAAAGEPPSGQVTDADGAATGFGGGFTEEGVAIDVEVPQTGRAYLELAGPSLTDESGPWDLALEGLDVFTHGGITADGQGAAFGPLSGLQFLGDVRPEVPFLIEDHAGGAFADWYDYDGTSHALYSRYHVVGVRKGDARYKVQVLGYYGEIEGAPVSAVYSMRVAEVGDDVGETVELEGIDGTAGGPDADDAAPNGCISLETLATVQLTLDEARSSEDWDLCFRRDVITVNGELGGPGSVEAVDLDEAATDTETLEDVQGRSASSEEAHFDDVGVATLDDPGLAWRGDRVISAFSDSWIEPGVSPVTPAVATWLVVGDDGAEYLVAFQSFANATASHPGTVTVRIKPVRD